MEHHSGLASCVYCSHKIGDLHHRFGFTNVAKQIIYVLLFFTYLNSGANLFLTKGFSKSANIAICSALDAGNGTFS